MMLKAVLFDLGETLVHFGPVDRARLFREGARQSYSYLHQQGFHLPDLATYIRRQWRVLRWASLLALLQFREVDVLRISARMAEQIGLRLDQHHLTEALWAWYEPLARQARIESALHHTLAWLKTHQIQLTLVSNTFVPGPTLDRHLQQLGLLEYFPTRVYSSDVRFRKPHPRIFKAALKKLELRPSEALFVGDRLRMDIWGAKSAGIRTVWKRTRRGWIGRVFRPDFTIDSIGQLPSVIHQLGGSQPEHPA